MKKYRIYIYDNEEYFDIFDDARQTYVNVHRGFYLQELCDFASMKHKAIVYLREYIKWNNMIAERIQSNIGNSNYNTENLLRLEYDQFGCYAFYNDVVDTFNTNKNIDLLNSSWLKQDSTQIMELQEDVSTYISNLTIGKKKALNFKSYFDIEIININGENCKVLYPKNIYEVIYFFLFEIIDKDIVVKICKRCDKYFPCLYNKNIQFCDRIDNNLNKTCRELKLDTLPEDDENKQKAYIMELFKRTYERVRHRVRKTKEQQLKYKYWSKEARSLRDKCINGEITVEYLKEWLSKSEQEMNDNST